jgi:hypothetical protein
MNKILTMSIEDIKNGYSYINQTDTYICNICGREYENGEIFEVSGRYFDAVKMIRIHNQKAHQDMLDILTSKDKKYTGITENQKELLKMIYSGMTDNEIAKKTQVAPATIRHQRFVFREKAKQAKLFLSIYELTIQGSEKDKNTTR